MPVMIGLGAAVGIIGSSMYQYKASNEAQFEHVISNAANAGIGLSAVQGYSHDKWFSSGEFQGRDGIVLTLGSCSINTAEYMVTESAKPDDISVLFRLLSEPLILDSATVVVSNIEQVKKLPGYDDCF